MTVARNEKNGQDGRRLAAQRMKRILLHCRGQMDECLRPEGVTTAQLGDAAGDRESR